jgi:hypothetical protein
MNFQKSSLLKAISFSCVFLFSSPLTHCQTNTNGKKMNKVNFKYGEIVELKLNEKVHIENSLSVILTSFSHKRPYVGGPTKATAYLTISSGKLSEEIMLSIHGIEGKSKSEDNITDAERYDSLSWKEYDLQLKSFNYDQSIEIIVTRRMP